MFRQEDYYDAEGGYWDVEGLEDDLRLAKAARFVVAASVDDGYPA